MYLFFSTCIWIEWAFLASFEGKKSTILYFAHPREVRKANYKYIEKLRSNMPPLWKKILRYSLNSRCHLSSCISACLALFLGSSCAISSSRNVKRSVILYQGSASLYPVLLGYSPFSSNYSVLLTSFYRHRKRLPNRHRLCIIEEKYKIL